MADERLRELIVEAYQELDFGVPLTAIESAAQARPRRRSAALAAASAVALLAVGVSVILADRPGTGSMPVGRASTAASGSPSPVMSGGRCVPAAKELLDSSPTYERSVPPSVPPLRFTVPLVPSQLIHLELYADEWVNVSCLVFDDSIDVTPKLDPVTLTADSRRGPPVHPVGKLTRKYSGIRVVGVLACGYVLGRTPAGTTRVEVYFADGTSADAQRLADGWYLAWGVGEDAADRFSEVTKVVAHTPGGTIVS